MKSGWDEGKKLKDLRDKMKLIVGLGNPGVSYERTRHNVGFLFLEKMQQDNRLTVWKEEKKFKGRVSKGKIADEDWLLLQPQTFMNLAGESVGALMRFYRLQASQDLILVYDDLDLKFGEFKIGRKGPRGHNGVLNVQQILGTTDFLQVRIGTDARAPENKISGMDYVLQTMTGEELVKLREEIFPKVEKELQSWL